MKTCRKGHTFSEDEHRQCPACQKKWRRQRYLKHRDTELRQNQKWIRDNRGSHSEKQREYRENNKEQVKQWYSEWCDKNPIHVIYRGMLRRCFNPEYEHFKNYGGRGITVCARWLGDDGYKNFESDMGPRPSPIHTINREDNDGNYDPGNVRWATKREQQRNRRGNVNVTICGRTQCVSAWAEELGMTPTSFKKRITNGWTGENLLLPKRA